MKASPIVLSLLCGVGAIACAGGTPGARPHDMSAARHDEAAGAETGAGNAHAAQYDAGASKRRDRCSATTARTGLDDACWTSITNPTAAHLDDARKHEKMAADHRAASKALRDAEARACVGIDAHDRDVSPFAHREDIANVETVADAVVVTFRPVPGLTAEWLQRVVDCHLARNASLGHAVPEMDYCPLVPNGATATVARTDRGVAVTVRGQNAATRAEIARRAQALRARR